MSSQLIDSERQTVQKALYLWGISLVAVPIVAAVVVEPDKYWWAPLGTLGVPSAGLLFASYAVLPRDGRKLWRIGDTGAEQRRQLTHIRTLAGVQGSIGIAFIATIGIFHADQLTMHFMITSMIWVASASVYFVAFWAMARMEARAAVH